MMSQEKNEKRKRERSGEVKTKKSVMERSEGVKEEGVMRWPAAWCGVGLCVRLFVRHFLMYSNRVANFSAGKTGQSKTNKFFVFGGQTTTRATYKRKGKKEQATQKGARMSPGGVGWL